MIEETVSWDSLSEPGLMTLLYGPFGVGKTDAIFTMPGKLIVYSTEPKDIKRTIKQHLVRNDQKDRKIKIKSYGDFDGYMDDINELKAKFDAGKRPCDSIGFDTLSFFQQETKLEMEDDRFKDSIVPDAKGNTKRDNILIDRFRLEQADWGGVKSAMIRLSKALGNIAKHGVYVTMTAAMVEYPKWDKSLEGAPALEGGFAQICAGFFDLVGAVLPGKDEDYPYPARVTFNHPDFVTRCSSDRLMKKRFVSLNIGTIIEKLEKE
ncbi:hypothetical protein LCGC14_0359310 [marine sediment metagenome]|uniref:Uncharacterized protein n=1 Tax=marine sediment metagenome TaxID=412755 RepID=A0A0F9VVP4_9ZZZZ|nr:hypothetical protein [Candidatus Aminicenantes bacterium]